MTQPDAETNRFAGVPWPEADREKLLADVRGWTETFRRGEPCPVCRWPFPAVGHPCVQDPAL